MHYQNNSIRIFQSIRVLKDWWWLVILIFLALAFKFPIGLFVLLIILWRVLELGLACHLLGMLQEPNRAQ